MKFCKYCGHPLNPSHKVCTRCGKPTGHSTQYVAKDNLSPSYPPGRYNDVYQFKKPNKPLIIISIVVAIIAITLVSVFLFLKHQLSPDQTIDQISEALNKEDHHKLSKLLTSEGEQLNDNQANAYLHFLKNEGKLNELSQDLKDSLTEMQKSKTTTHTVSINKLVIIKVAKNGKHFGLFDRYKFDIPRYSIAMYSKDNGKIDYDYNGKTHTVHLKKDEPVHVGTFPLGNYQLDAKKQVGNKTFKGNIVILMTPARSIVKENFKEKRFMVKPNNSYEVNDIKLFINDKAVERFDENKIYGPYGPNEKVVVHLEGKVGKHTVKTNSESVEVPKGVEEYKTITLAFNREEISKFDEEKDTSDDSKKVEEDKKTKDSDAEKEKTQSEDKNNKDDEDSNEDKKKTDLTEEQAEEIVKKYDKDNLKGSEYSFELEPYQRRDDIDIVKVKDQKGSLLYTYMIYTKVRFITKLNDKDVAISSGFYD